MKGVDLDQVFAPGEMRRKGLEMLQKEMQLYPESSVFLEPIIKKFSQPPKSEQRLLNICPLFYSC
jgi:hypothetical protein